MIKLSGEQQIALSVLSRIPAGCAEAMLLAHGISEDQLVALASDGLCTMEPSLIRISGRERIVVWVQITKAGTLAITDGAPARMYLLERIAELPRLTQRVSFMTDHGEQRNEWSGPLLWDVLVDTGSVDPTKPDDQVHIAVRVTGADGHAAVVALAEIAPQFAGRPFQIADSVNGVPLRAHSFRLIVPGDRRGRRSVREVIRIDLG